MSDVGHRNAPRNAGCAVCGGPCREGECQTNPDRERPARAAIILLREHEPLDELTVWSKVQAGEYLVMERPAAMWSSDKTKLYGLLAMPPEETTLVNPVKE